MTRRALPEPSVFFVRRNMDKNDTIRLPISWSGSADAAKTECPKAIFVVYVVRYLAAFVKTAELLSMHHLVLDHRCLAE